MEVYRFHNYIACICLLHVFNLIIVHSQENIQIKLNATISEEYKIILNWKLNIETSESTRYQVEVINEENESFFYPGIHTFI